MDNKEKFRGLCLEVLPLINGIVEAVKRNGYKSMAIPPDNLPGSNQYQPTPFQTHSPIEQTSVSMSCCRYRSAFHGLSANWHKQGKSPPDSQMPCYKPFSHAADPATEFPL